jgi:hypothetical protein
MQASTRSRNKPMQGRNFPERPRLGTYQRPTSSRASLARSGPLTAGLSAKRTGLEAGRGWPVSLGDVSKGRIAPLKEPPWERPESAL